jgi:ABC-type antimicrobial peptide transport system permease subunit
MTFGTLALGLSTIGLYAALAFAVGERTREIAVRLALGASRADVGGLVFRRGMAIVSLGIAAASRRASSRARSSPPALWRQRLRTAPDR